MDVLFTIAFAVNGYSTLEVSKWASSLWDALKFEVWNGENSDTIAASLSVITNIAKALSDPTADWANADIPSAKPLLSIITECNRRVADNRPENIAKTGSILHAIAEATPYAFSWVTRRFLPVMLTLWQSITSEDAKGVLLTVLNTILEARVALDEELDKELSRAQEGSATDLDLSTQNAQIKNSLASTLVPFQRNLIDDVYFNAMTDNISSSVDGIEYRAATIRGLVVLMRIRNMLSDFEKGTIVEALNSILLQPKQIDSVKREAILGLQNMSSADPANFQTITLANFMNKLPKHIAEEGIQRQLQLEHVISLFDSLVQIACTAICNFDEENVDASPPPRDRVFTAFQQAMMTKLVNILEHNGQLQYANIVLGAIYHGIISYDAVLELQLKSSTSPAVSARNSWHHPYAWIVLEIYKHIVEVKQVDAKMPYVGFTLALGEDEQTVNKFVSLVGNITTLTLRSRQTTPKNNFLNSNDKSAPSQVWSLFINSAPESIDKTQMDLIGGPSEKLLANALSMSLVAGVRREVSLL
jgi:DNA repair/transcription protein MET18/MMS19